MRSAISFCRICPGNCGTVLEIDDDRIVSIRGDREHALTSGYACSKGIHAGELHHRSDRILAPLKRADDGSWERIEPERAFDEIAAKLEKIIDRDGPEAVAGFLGTAGFNNATATLMLPAWLKAIGSPSYFSAFTIDQSSHTVTAGRLGAWSAGRHTWATADVWMLFGNNPLLSVCGGGGVPYYNPTKSMKEAKARGMKLIVVDPRRTETAQHADLFLQVRPGEDASLVCGLLRTILVEGLGDDEFCARHVDGLVRLREAVEPFTPEYVERRAGIAPAALRSAAGMFAGAKRGAAGCSTGISMSPTSNLTDHLIELLNVVCGRYMRAGERVPNPGILTRGRPAYAEVVAPSRSWDSGRKLRTRGLGMLFTEFGGEYPAAALPDEILTEGEGRIRSLVVVGGNPAVAIPDQPKVVRALRSLELLVTVEPFMTATARLAHYVLPPTLMYERSDYPMIYGQLRRLPSAFAIHASPVVRPPQGSEVVDDWYVLWALAKRLGARMELDGVPLDMETAPTTDELLAIIARGSPVPLEEVRADPRGRVFDLPPQVVEPARPGSDARFDVLPPDVAGELAAYRDEASADPSYSLRLTVRRMRHVMNSYRPLTDAGRGDPAFNEAFLNPDDLAKLELAPGDSVEVVSDGGRIPARVAADDRLLPGVVSMAHCWGGLADDPGEYEREGSCTGALVSTDRDYQAVNAMPRMTAIPVNVVPVRADASKG